MNIEKLKAIETEVITAINEVNTLDELSEVFNKYLAKKGLVSSLGVHMKDLEPSERATFGKALNELRKNVNETYEAKKLALEEIALNKQLKSETIDLSLPGVNYLPGGRNPFYLIKDEIEAIFIALGYSVEEGPEVESDHYNFELLNIPKDHPAREMQDSFYFDEQYLLRTHTSPVQARVMQAAKGKPIKIICPGKVYRRDADDMTHSHQFAQVEGLVIDKNINLAHLYSALDIFVKAMFGEKREIRFRPSYFPFTEPSIEVDVSCFECSGSGCSVCKQTGWIEILGGGMVHPDVLAMNGYDPDSYSGFAFGIGIERVAMLRYGIDDIRKIYQNDIRFLSQFRKQD